MANPCKIRLHGIEPDIEDKTFLILKKLHRKILTKAIRLTNLKRIKRNKYNNSFVVRAGAYQDAANIIMDEMENLQ